MSTSNGHLPQWGLLDAAGYQGEGMPGLAGHDIRGEGHGGGAGRDVPGSVSFTGTLPSGGEAAPGALAVVVVCKNLDHYRQSAYFKMPRA